MSGFQKINWSRISSIWQKVGNRLLEKLSQTSSNSKKIFIVLFCNFLCLVDLRICICLNSVKLSLELSTNFCLQRMRFSQRALVGLIGTKYSRMDQEKLAEERLKKLKVCFRQIIPFQIF